VDKGLHARSQRLAGENRVVAVRDVKNKNQSAARILSLV
jgi:hypothetical protein